MTASKPERRTILSEDGELQDLDSLLNEPESSAEPLYCTRCGTPNAPEANYCRKCGKSMQEQAIFNAEMPRMESKPKRKNDHEHNINIQVGRERYTEAAIQPNVMNFWGMVQRLIMLVFVAGMVITSFAPIEGSNSAGVSLFVLLAWFLVEAVRGDKNRRANFFSAMAEGVTMVFVSGMVITALATQNGVLALPILLAWFLVEAVRS